MKTLHAYCLTEYSSSYLSCWFLQTRTPACPGQGSCIFQAQYRRESKTGTQQVI